MKKLLLVIPFLFFGCAEILELALKPEVKFLSREHTPAYSYDAGLIDTVVSWDDWNEFCYRDDIKIISQRTIAGAYEIIFEYKEEQMSRSHYFYRIKNVGKDTAYYVHVKVNTTEGEKSLLYRRIYLPKEEDSGTVWLDHGEEFIGSASVDYESRE